MPDLTVSANVDTMLAAADTAAMRTAIGLGTTDSPTFLALALAGQSLTGTQATSIAEISTTWNTTGSPTALKLDVTNTASNAASALLDLRVGGASRFRVLVDGQVVGSVATFSSYAIITNIYTRSDSSFIKLGAADDVCLFRGGANTLYQRNGTNAQNLWLANTYTDASNYERCAFGWASNVLRIGTEMLGTGTARAVALHTGGTVRLGIYAAGSAYQVPAATATPASNGDLVVEATSNTLLTFKLRGTDGTVRTGTLALA